VGLSKFDTLSEAGDGRPHIDKAYLKGGLFDLTAAGMIARYGYGGDCAEVTSVFKMLRTTP
jgi:hypothetical protein